MEVARIGSATLILGDCLAVMPTLAPVGAVITDPPYEDHMHRSKAKAADRPRGIRTDGHASPAALDFASITAIRADAAQKMTALSVGWVLAFCTPEGIAPWRDALEAAGARYKRACFWHKPDSAPQFNGQGPAMAVECIVAAWAGKGHSRWNGGGGRNLWSHPCRPSGRTGLHPTEKPLSLMMELVGLFSNVGDVVCDPFMGCGSTGVASVRLGRGFVGIERDRRYFDAACARLEDAARQGDFLTPPPPSVQQLVMGV